MTSTRCCPIASRYARTAFSKRLHISADPIGQDGGNNLFAYAGLNPVRNVDLFGLDTRPVSPGPIRPPDAGAREGGAYGVNRTNARGNYPHTGVDLLAPSGADVFAPISGNAFPSGSEGLMICERKGTICCNGQDFPKIVCWRLVHITPSASGRVGEGDVVGSVNSQNPPIPSHAHVEYYETTCEGLASGGDPNGLQRLDPTTRLPAP